MMKVAAVVASLVLVVCAVDETQWERAPAAVDSANTHHSGTGTSLLTKLRSAVKQIELLADEVDATLSVADNNHNSADMYNWMPPPASGQMLKCC